MSAASWLGRVWAWLRHDSPTEPRPGVRLVRRVEIECPHGRGHVTVDVVTDAHGTPDVVLRCSAHASCPPTCDQSCRECAAVVRTPATALVVYPPGRGPNDAAD